MIIYRYANRYYRTPSLPATVERPHMELHPSGTVAALRAELSVARYLLRAAVDLGLVDGFELGDRIRQYLAQSTEDPAL